MTRPNPHPTHLEAVAHAAASVVSGGRAMTYEMPKEIPTEEERLAAYAEWCEANPGECVLCNPHICDDDCRACELKGGE